MPSFDLGQATTSGYDWVDVKSWTQKKNETVVHSQVTGNNAVCKPYVTGDRYGLAQMSTWSSNEHLRHVENVYACE